MHKYRNSTPSKNCCRYTDTNAPVQLCGLPPPLTQRLHRLTQQGGTDHHMLTQHEKTQTHTRVPPPTSESIIHQDYKTNP